MSKRLLIGLFVVLAFCLSQITLVKAEETKSAPVAKTEKAKVSPQRRALAANEVAVCGCGKVFVPNATTKYVEYNGKSYACCSDPCHQKMAVDPAAAAKMADDNMAKLMAASAMPAQAPAATPAPPAPSGTDKK